MMIQEETKIRIAKMIAQAYTSGDFEPLFPLMTEDYEHHSYWVWEPMVGKNTVIPYYRGKGNTLKRSPAKVKTQLVRTIGPEMKEIPGTVLVNGETMKQNDHAYLWTDPGQICVLMVQTVDDGSVVQTLAMPTINEEGMLTQLLITEPALFNFEAVEIKDDI